MGLFDFLFANKDTSVQEEKESIASTDVPQKVSHEVPQTEPQYKKVSFITPDTSIPYYQWYKSFVHYKEVRKIVHNFGLKYDVYNFSLYLNSTDFLYHYVKDHIVKMYGVADFTPLCYDCTIDYQEIKYKTEMNAKYGDLINTAGRNPWDIFDFGVHDETRDQLDMLVNLFNREGYNTSNSSTAMLIAEAFKFDAILAAYNRYKDDSENENSDNFLNQFVDSSYKELPLPEPESSKYPPVLKYDKLAYISYVLYKQGSHLKFSSLDDLYELILKKKEEKIQHSLLADNDPEEFNSHANTEYLSTGSNNGSPFSSIPDIDVVTPYELEQMVKEQFTSMGYEAVATKKSGDQGADVIVKESSTGLITVVQVKQYSDSKVGNKAVQEVLAGKEFYDADRAIVMTTSYFTKSATELAEKTDVELMDRDDFLAFMS